MAKKGKFKLTETQTIEICERYLAGENSSGLAVIYEVNSGTIRNILERNSISRRSLSEVHRTCTLNQAAFAKQTPEALYWAGFLMADGCVQLSTIRLPYISIELSARDTKHVKKFKQFLSSSHKITMAKRKYQTGYTNSARLQVSSQQLADDLALYGVIPRKSLVAEATSVASGSIDFWRGVIDGDGCLGLYYSSPTRPNKDPLLQLYGAKPLMEQFLAFVKTHIKTKATVRPAGTIFQISLKSAPALKIIKLLYKDCTLALSRKHRKALEMLNWAT